MRALVRWTEGDAVDSIEDATIVMSPDSLAAITGRAAAGNVTLIRPLYGNIYTNFVPSDLERIGINLGDTFTVTHKAQSHPITYAKAYSDVPYEAWVAFIDSEGHVQISRNYANAAETLSAQSGDPLLLSN